MEVGLRKLEKEREAREGDKEREGGKTM